MNVGLRAFLVIADNLAQNEVEPLMPLHNGKTRLIFFLLKYFID